MCVLTEPDPYRKMVTSISPLAFPLIPNQYKALSIQHRYIIESTLLHVTQGRVKSVHNAEYT